MNLNIDDGIANFFFFFVLEKRNEVSVFKAARCPGAACS